MQEQQTCSGRKRGLIVQEEQTGERVGSGQGGRAEGIAAVQQSTM